LVVEVGCTEDDLRELTEKCDQLAKIPLKSMTCQMQREREDNEVLRLSLLEKLQKIQERLTLIEEEKRRFRTPPPKQLPEPPSYVQRDIF